MCLALAILTGCTTAEIEKTIAPKAKPAQRTEFLGDKRMFPRADLPFHSAWVKDGFDKTDFSKVYIAPVNLKHLKEMDWWDEIEGQVTDKDLMKKVEKVADYTRDVFKDAFANDPQQKYKLVARPDDKTLIVEIAIIEAIPNKSGFEVITRGLGLINPIVGVAGTVARSQGSKSSVAFEARIRDGRTNEIVAQFADREQEKTSYINTKDFEWYGHIEAIISEWADQFVQIANRAPDEMIADTPGFDLKVW
jgi:hypothetical protein